MVNNGSQKPSGIELYPLAGVFTRFLAITGLFFNCEWFFPSPTGKRWDPDNFSQDLRKINREHELDWSCLDFRHTFGSHLAQKGESLYKIAQLMGNSPEICRRHYAALIPEQMVDTAEFKKSALAKPMGDPELKVMIKRLLEKLDGDGICDSMHYTPEGIRANGTFSR